MAERTLISKVQQLSDLELAALICLVSREHCIIETEPEGLDDLVQELELISSDVFGLTHAVIDCSSHTTLDDFVQAIMTVGSTATPSRSSSPLWSRQDSYFLFKPGGGGGGGGVTGSRLIPSDNLADGRSIASVLIARNLDRAPKPVQIQALELMRTGRMYTRTSVQAVPKRFLLVALLAAAGSETGDVPARLTRHLNDHIFISHYHDLEDGFANLEDTYEEEEEEGDGDSISSVVKKKTNHDDPALEPRISKEDIDSLSRQSEKVTVSVELTQYQHNIISFLRLHRAVAGGVTAMATIHFEKLIKCLATLHGMSFATPSLVALATRKIYPHRIQMTRPEKERSMQWGSDLDPVAEFLDGIGPEDIIDDVLGSSGAEAPL